MVPVRYNIGTAASPGPYCTFGEFRLDLAQQRVWKNGAPLALRRKAVQVLHYLLAHRDRLIGHDELLGGVWGDTHVTQAVLKVCVKEIREALGDRSEAPRFIATVPRRGYRWIAPVEADATGAAGYAPTQLVGREAELRELFRALATARAGERQIVFVVGEAGIGKTSMVDTFLAMACTDGAAPRVGRGQCIDHFGSGEPYLPLLAALGELCRVSGKPFVDLLSRSAPTWLLQMPSLVTEPAAEALRRRTLGVGRERMLRELAEALEIRIAGDESFGASIILVLEDLHWADAATVDFLAFVARRRLPARLLVIGTYRPAEVVIRRHPIGDVKQDLLIHRLCRELALPLLSETAVAQYVARRFGDGVLGELPFPLHRSTEGNPLFVVQVLDDLIMRGAIVEDDGTWRLQEGIADIFETVPDDLRELIEKEAERRTPSERRLLEAASVAGEEFYVEPVADAIAEPAVKIERRCQKLAREQQFFRKLEPQACPDGTTRARYAFVHTLHRKVIYERLPAAIRPELHRRIGESEERFHGDDTRGAAAALATHFAKSGDWRRAVRYLAVAGQGALVRFSSHQAIGYFRRALEALARIPELPARAEEELELLLGLGVPLVATRGLGAPEVAEVYSRAQELCQEIGETPRSFPVLRGLYTYYLTRAELDEARDLATRMARLARRPPDSDLMPEACFALGSALFYRGELAEGMTELERGIECYDETLHGTHNLLYGHDPGVYCAALAAWGLWIQGHPDRALERARQALSLALRLGSPADRGLALSFLSTTHLLRGEAEEARRVSEEGIATSMEHDLFYWLNSSLMCQGAALSLQGETARGIPLLERGFAGWEAVGMYVGGTLWLARLADAHRADGDSKKARSVLERAFELMERHGARWWEAELHRLRGELLLADGEGNAPNGGSVVEACFLRALDVARRQAATSLELRAALSLGRFRRRRDGGAGRAPSPERGAIRARHRPSLPRDRGFDESCDEAGSIGDPPAVVTAGGLVQHGLPRAPR